MNNTEERIPPIHPGEILFDEIMQPRAIGINALAKHMGIRPNRISEIVNGKRSITVDTAMRLALVFPFTTPGFWLGLQTDYDIEVTELARGASLRKEVKQYPNTAHHQDLQ
jgi:addiction module HigA family antidote